MIKGINFVENNNNKIIEISGKEDRLESLQLAASIHKNTRADILKYIKPGLKLSELEEAITNTINMYTNNKGINGGIAFPPSLSISECIAHFTPYNTIDRTLKYSDNLKIDIGVSVNGWIIDSAFTIYFNEELKELHDTAKEATYIGCNTIGMDVNINDWAETIDEYISSKEIYFKKKNDKTAKLYNIKNIKNLGGHTIIKNNVHGGMFIPSYRIPFNNGQRFGEGVYAIEPFCSILSDTYELNYNEITNFKLKTISSPIENNIFKKFNYNIFTRKHVDNHNISDFNKISSKLIPYPPLYSTDLNDYSAQYEHTVYLDSNKKIILSKGLDY